jgi:hypothetical protein
MFRILCGALPLVLGCQVDDLDGEVEGEGDETLEARGACNDGLDNDFDGAIDASAIRTKLIRRVKEEMAGVKLEDADVVVCGGRGIGGPEGLLSSRSWRLLRRRCDRPP